MSKETIYIYMLQMKEQGPNTFLFASATACVALCSLQAQVRLDALELTLSGYCQRPGEAVQPANSSHQGNLSSPRLGDIAYRLGQPYLLLQSIRAKSDKGLVWP